MFLKNIQPIAHRGLHNAKNNIMENSAAAFNAAMKMGFAIECDLQMCKDGIIVFHDDNVERLTKEKGKVKEYKIQELAGMKLGESNDCIHSLEWHLVQVNGKVPLVVEIKKLKENGDEEKYVKQVAENIEKYNGDIALMSFDVDVMKLCKRFINEKPCGVVIDEKNEKIMEIIKEYKLDFVAYDVNQAPNEVTQEMKKQKKPVLTWTVTDNIQAQNARQWADQIIFEGFLPEGFIPDAS